MSLPKTTFILPSGEMRSLEAPLQVPVRELLPRLIAEFKLPVVGPLGKEGPPVGWELYDEVAGRVLCETDPLAPAAASSDDRLRIREAVAQPRRARTTHSVVRITVTDAHPNCPVFHTGDVFYIRKNVLDTEVSVSKNFCIHTLFILYKTVESLRNGPVGEKRRLNCLDKGLAKFELERMPDEHASTGRAAGEHPDRLASR